MAQRMALIHCEPDRRKFSGPKRSRYPEIDESVVNYVKDRRRQALPVTYDMMRFEANRLARSKNIPGTQFEASMGWVKRLMRRYGLSLQRRTAVCQKLPPEFELQLMNFQKYIIELRKAENYLLAQIGNADETPVYLDMPMNYTVGKTGTRQVLLKTCCYDKMRVTVMLGAWQTDGNCLHSLF